MMLKPKVNWYSIVILVSLLIFDISIAYAAPVLTISNYKLVSTKRITRTLFEYAYKADIKNTGTTRAFGGFCIVSS